jgi:hypothetical protein
MRKLLLVAFAAGAMGVAALPSTSLASNSSQSAPAVVHKCPPGNHDAQYCERCPDNEAALQSTANAAATAALAAAQSLPDSAKSISFTFTPTACGHFQFKLLFGVPREGHLVFIPVAIAVTTTKAGTPLTITAPLTGFGRLTLAQYGASGDTLHLEVVATETSKSHSATKTLVGTDSP